MLNKLDDFPIHQTPEPLSHPSTSDRNVYDRTWFNGYANDGSYYFGLGMAVYPHRRILDGAFSVVRPGGQQHCFFGSRRAPDERTDMSVGPLRIEVIEPMRTTRVILDSNSSGLACDLTFSALTASIEEARQTLWNGSRRVMDATRFDQFGTWQGSLETPEGTIKIDSKQCRATKDRSWGVRHVGEAEIGGAPVVPEGIFFLMGATVLGRPHHTCDIFRRPRWARTGARRTYRTAVSRHGCDSRYRRRPGETYGNRPASNHLSPGHKTGAACGTRPDTPRRFNSHHHHGANTEISNERLGLCSPQMAPGQLAGRISAGAREL